MRFHDLVISQMSSILRARTLSERSGCQTSGLVSVSMQLSCEGEGFGPVRATYPSLEKRRVLAAGACAAALVWLALAGSLAARLPMGWDEGSAIVRSEPPHWPFTTCREGHPALVAVLISAGQALAGGWLAPLAAARLGPMLFFAAGAAAMYYRLGRQYGSVSAMVALAAIVLQPRLFAHLRFASFDGVLVSAWILAWALFPAPDVPATEIRARPGKRKMVSFPRLTGGLLWGIALGLAFSAKATGWLALIPFALWTLVCRDRRGAWALAMGLPAAVLTFWLTNPPLWYHPVEGTLTFLRLNLHRQELPGLNIATQFFGRIYDLGHPLPWYNTFVWAGITVPVGLLGLFGVGLGRVIARRRQEPAGVLLAMHWAVLMLVRALPGTPPHDAERLILPSFAFLAALAGLGAGWVVERATRHRRIAIAALTALLGCTATSLFWYKPQWLSYYNLLAGGLRGATAAGMEPAYYWDGLDEEVLDWLHRHTGAGEKVIFAAPPTENLALLYRWGLLRCEYRARAPGQPRWYVVQHRPSAWTANHRQWLAGARPAFQKRIRAEGIGPWCLDVPVISIYPVVPSGAACLGESSPAVAAPGETGEGWRTKVTRRPPDDQ